MFQITISFFNKATYRKSLKEIFLGRPWLWWPKIFEVLIWNPHFDPWFIMNSGKSINLKTRFDPFLFTQNDFLQPVASFLVSLLLMCNGNQDNDFDKLCSATLIDSIHESLFPWLKLPNFGHMTTSTI